MGAGYRRSAGEGSSMNTRHWNIEVSDRQGNRAQWRVLPEQHPHPLDAAQATTQWTRADGQYSRVMVCAGECEGGK